MTRTHKTFILKSTTIFGEIISQIIPISIPNYSPELVEFVGIMLGDGNVFVREHTHGRSKAVHQVRICGNKTFEQEYMLNFVSPLIHFLFKTNTFTKLAKSQDAMYVCVNSKNLVNYLGTIGLPPGNKKHNKISIPNWIKQNPEFLKACIRGLVDTDGSVHHLSNKDPHLIRINFSSHNPVLFDDFYNCLTELGYRCCKTEYHNICITAKQHVNKYITEIGFSNTKHLKRLNLLRNYSPIV